MSKKTKRQGQPNSAFSKAIRDALKAARHSEVTVEAKPTKPGFNALIRGLIERATGRGKDNG